MLRGLLHEEKLKTEIGKRRVRITLNEGEALQDCRQDKGKGRLDAALWTRSTLGKAATYPDKARGRNERSI